MKKKLLALFLFSFIFVAPQTSVAFFDKYVEDVDVKVQSTNRYFLESDIANDSNDINVSEARFDVEIDINPNSDISWELDFINKHVFIDGNSSSVDLPALLVGRGMRLGTKFPIPFMDDPDYRLGVAAVPSYYTDSWEDSFSNFETGAFRWLSEVWIDYRGDEPFSWKFGAIILPEHEDFILPLIDVRYSFNENWQVRLLSDDLGLVYMPNEQWEFFTEFRYVLDEFEITSGDIDGRVLRQKQNTAGLGFQYNFNPVSYIKATSGWGINRSFQFQDNISQTEVDIKDAPYFTLEFAWQF